MAEGFLLEYNRSILLLGLSLSSKMSSESTRTVISSNISETETDGLSAMKDRNKEEKVQDLCSKGKWSFRILIVVVTLLSTFTTMNFLFPECHYPQRKCKTVNGTVWFTSTF